MLRVTIAGPGKNALSGALMGRLLEQVEEAAGQPILLTGAGDAFSAGLDLDEVAGLDVPGMERFLDLLERVMSALYLYPGPVAAAVNGHAIAGGCVAVLCADYRVMTDDPRARIGLNEVALGVTFPPRILAAVLSRIPRRHRERVLLGAQLFDPAAALEVGLVDRVSANPVTEASAWLEVVGKHSPRAYAATKLSLRDDLEQAHRTWEKWVAESMPTWTDPALRQTIARILRR